MSQDKCCKENKCCVDIIICILTSLVAFVIGLLIGGLTGIITALGIGAIIAMKITSIYNLDFDLQVIISAVVAALTIGGKAKCKLIAQEYSSQIVDKFTKIINILNFSKKNK